jgi:hypothetical protein
VPKSWLCSQQCALVPQLGFASTAIVLNNTNPFSLPYANSAGLAEAIQPDFEQHSEDHWRQIQKFAIRTIMVNY